MQLSRMQDIGGCRAVVSSVEAVGELVDHYTTKSRIKHKLVRTYPYITEPKASGYQRHPSHGARSSVCSV